MKIKISGITPESIVDGPGLRFVVFTQGCPHNCDGCHNPQTHDFNGGIELDTDFIYKKFKETKLSKDVTFSGGEPFSQPEALYELSEKFSEDNVNIVCFSGYTFEQLLCMSEKNEFILKLLANIDILVDGKFDINKKSYELKFKGSANQRVLDCKESLKLGRAVETEW